MHSGKTWKNISKWLTEERKITLPKGSEFRALFNTVDNSFDIVPGETGIPRRVTLKEWEKFCEKFNNVKSQGFDPFRPGHYARISYNSSYLVAILKAYEDKSR